MHLLGKHLLPWFWAWIFDPEIRLRDAWFTAVLLWLLVLRFIQIMHGV